MAEQRTTDERLHVLERTIFALLTQGLDQRTPLYKSLWNLLLQELKWP